MDGPSPENGRLDALLRITTTTICGTDVHVLRGECPVARGLTIGQGPVGLIARLGAAVQSYREGQRVISGAITPSGWSNACLCDVCSQGGAGSEHGWKAMGGWKLGNTIDGCQAEFVMVPDAMANLAPVPDGLSGEQVLMCPDIMSTGFSGAETAARPQPATGVQAQRVESFVPLKWDRVGGVSAARMPTSHRSTCGPMRSVRCPVTWRCST